MTKEEWRARMDLTKDHPNDLVDLTNRKEDGQWLARDAAGRTSPGLTAQEARDNLKLGAIYLQEDAREWYQAKAEQENTQVVKKVDRERGIVTVGDCDVTDEEIESWFEGTDFEGV